MDDRLIIAATDNPEMRYGAAILIPDPFIFHQHGAKKTLVVSSLEHGRVQRAIRGDRHRDAILLEPFYEQVQKEKKWREGSVLAKIAALYLKSKKIKKVVMPRSATALHVETLRKRGVAVRIADDLFPERKVKRADELREIQKVRNATVKAMRHVITIIKRSKIGPKKELIHQGKKLTSAFLRREARKLLLDHDCEAPSLIISHGAQAAQPHHEGSGVLKAHEAIVLDFYPRSMASGYWFDMTRTVCKGAPPKELQKMWRAVKAAQDVATKKIKAGVAAKSIHEAAAQELGRRGYATKNGEGFIHSTGHGLGLEIHEAPSIGEKSAERLTANMVITVEPGLYYKRFGGVRLENTLLVTTTGCKDMTRMGRVLRL